MIENVMGITIKGASFENDTYLQFFEESQHKRVCLLYGRNGAGKSTLLKIIMGEVLLDKGTFYKNPRYRIKYLDQHAEMSRGFSLR